MIKDIVTCYYFGLYKRGRMSRTIYGINPVFEALRYLPEQVRQVLADETKKKNLTKISDLAKTSGVPLSWVSGKQIDKMAPGANHQGIACVADDFSYTSVSEFLEKCTDPKSLVVVADQVEDPQNLGSMLRSMGVFGAQLLVILKNRAAGITPAVVKVSAGAAGIVPVARENALGSVLERFKKSGYWVYGLEADGESFLHEENLSGNVVIVVGSEGKGLSDLVRKRCDHVCKLPAGGPIGSLNAATALACALYEVVRQTEVKAKKV